VLELTTVFTAARDGVDELLGVVPADALRVDDGQPTSYVGDPSIGEVGP
jgi:hypothetical protein